MSRWSRLSRSEKSLVVVAAVVLVAVLALALGSDDLNLGVGGSTTTSRRRMGEILSRTHDGRYRSAEDYHWSRARATQPVYLDDSVFAGHDSSVTVKLERGNEVHVRENSLVVFEEEQRQVIPSFKRGQFHLRFDGRIKLAINGRTTTLHGDHTEVELSVGGAHAPHVKVTRGELRLNTPEGAPPIVVKLDQDSELPAAVFAARAPASDTPATDTPATDTPSAPAAPVIPKPFFAHDRPEFTYVWTRDDLYAVDAERHVVVPRATPPRVGLPVELDWSHSDVYPVVGVQAGPSADLADAAIVGAVHGEPSRLTVSEGPNFVRIAADERTWSNAIPFEVRFDFAPLGAREIDTPVADALVRTETLDLGAALAAGDHGAIIQIDDQPTFGRASTFWSVDGRVTIPTARDGVLYARVRGVNDHDQITEWSRARRFTLRAPPAPVAAPPVTPPAPVVAEVPPPVVVAPAPPPPPPAEIMTPPPAPLPPNASVSATGVYARVQSSRQPLSNRAPRDFTGVEFAGTRWFGADGVDAAVKLLRSTDASWIADLGVDYKHRFALNLAPAARDVIVTPSIGVAVHRASVSPYLSPAYEVLKLGLDVRWPFLTDWSVGVAGAAGFGRGGTQTLDGQIQLHYRIDSSWSLKAGYGVDLLRTNAPGAAPGGVTPYREGYGQYRLGLDFSF